jgi:hypothetical protein
VLDDLSRLTREKWRPATLSRLCALGARTSDQFDLLEVHWSALVDYLGSIAASSLPRIGPRSRRSRPRSRASWRTLGPVADLEQALLRTRAFVSLLRCTDMRSI